LADKYKPFSIYDDDEEEPKPPRLSFEDAPEKEADLGLEIQDSHTAEDETTRRQLMEQLGQSLPPAEDPDRRKAAASSPPPEEEAAPFLHGRAEGNAVERTKRIIRERRDAGKIHDRRKTASIFDRPIEADKPIRPGHAAWHPFGYRAAANWFILPALLVFGMFYLYPTIIGFQISFTHFDPLGNSTPVGLANYQRAFHDPLFHQTVLNAAAFTLLSLVLGFWPPILLAVLLHEAPKGKGILKALYLVPFILPAVPAANLWKWIFDQGFGILNASIGMLPGMENPHIGWLSDPRFALLSIVIMFVWKNTGWFMLIYYAALQNLSDDVYEAAEMDGAGIVRRFFSITLPWLKNVMRILFIIQVLITFQIFTEVYVMTNGDPMHVTEVLGTYIYKTAFGAMDLGYASAMAMLMFLVLAVFSMIRFAQVRRAGA
jgi:multiple sugar transport system permease protein